MDVVINKIESLERCILRIKEVYQGNYENLKDYTKQDSIVLNLQRACELSIDIANYIIAKHKLMLPKTSKAVFEVLLENKILDENISLKMKKMIGFRNIAIHDYRKLDVKIIHSILENNLNDFKDFTDKILIFLKK